MPCSDGIEFFRCMHNGVIKFIKPEDCVMTKVICKMQPKTFEMPEEKKEKVD